MHVSSLLPTHTHTNTHTHTHTHTHTGSPTMHAHKLGPLLIFLANDMNHWYDGKIVTDHTQPINSPSRTFLLRFVLLGWCADYPGLGECSNFSHAAGGHHSCHWCEVPGEYSNGLKRMLYPAIRRYVLY